MNPAEFISQFESSWFARVDINEEDKSARVMVRLSVISCYWYEVRMQAVCKVNRMEIDIKANHQGAERKPVFNAT